MDGTLLTATQQITAENREAIRRAQSQGIEVIIATGRSYTEASFVLDAAGLTCPMICANGAEIRSPESGRHLYRSRGRRHLPRRTRRPARDDREPDRQRLQVRQEPGDRAPHAAV